MDDQAHLRRGRRGQRRRQLGYVPNVAQSGRTLLGIRLFFGPVPALFSAVAWPLLVWYPITRASHAEMRRKLEAEESLKD